GCSRAALCSLLCGEGIAPQAHALAAEVLGNIEGVKPCLAQAGVVFSRIDGLTVVQRRARRKICCQLPTVLLQARVFLGDLKVYASAAVRPHPCGDKNTTLEV